MSQPCTIIFDGEEIRGIADEPLIDFLEGHGIALPSVCYHPSLGAIETCDACWVEVNGELKRGCALRTQEGMQISSRDPQAVAARHEGMDRLLSKHELYCTVCENNNGDCSLHNAVVEMDIPIQRYEFQPKPHAKDTTSPFYTYDPDQCILCGRCVEACQNIEVNETLSIDYASENPRVLWDGGKEINDSSCVHCGHCVTVCPCNALMENSMDEHAGPLTSMPWSLKRPMIEIVKKIETTISAKPITGISEIDSAWRQPGIKRTKTVCTYCGVGCSFEMWTRDRHILKVQPSPDAPANGISTCIKGKFAWDFVNSEKRLTTPLIRENGRFREASWEEALDLVARRLLEVRDTHGSNSLGFIGSSKASNEEAYLTQKIARLIIGTNSVDNSSRYCQNPATKGLFRTVGYGGDAGTIKDIEQAEVVVLVGSNTAENHPVIASKIKAAQKLRGQKLIVMDPRKHEMAERADIFLRPNASTDLIWASALSRYMFDNHLADLDFLGRWVNNVEEYRRSLEPFTLDFAEFKTGISKQELINTAEMIGRAKNVCLLWAMGITQHSHGSDTSTALSNLLLVTGNYGKPGTGGYPMRGHNNVQGASDFGCLRNMYPGYDKVTDESARQRWAKGWGVDPSQLSNEVGEGNFLMVQSADQGDIKAMYVIGEETAFSDANTHNVHSAFENLDFMVVQDIFLSRTAEFADVVLPACPSVEKDGTFVNTERRIQRFYEVLPPLGDSRPDWRILTDLAARMGHDWGYTHPSQIMQECASISPMFAGVTYERLEGWKSLSWPVAADGTDTPLLYTDGFHTEDGKANLFPMEWKEPEEATDAEYDLSLDNGRILEQFQGANQTGRSQGIWDQAPHGFVEVSPELAAERGIKEGTWVRITSRRGSIDFPALITDRVAGKTLFMPIHFGKPGVNALTGEHNDPVVQTPAYKETAVKLEVLDKRTEPPLPSTNYRFGRRTPNQGVAVEVKWMQEDYRLPPAQQTNPRKM
ncbi:formate dehydrogenase subunit alpha [Vreelandella sulfidaeris]|jgi:formate dehydrogenase major subunit|uniref:nitrate reductase (cytochrome) n=3 Tax=Vreelandella TaxID=3137766 RepID=A0A365TI25_9GAMM|nr:MULTISPECIES: formate dehydrogenase subunit alpha [Halomonas]AJY52904.1 formate dehydrogenase, alpha subunit [Halomonas sp. KO116]NVF16313.1 formate dehydrogenase subunit alpha [Halomonas maris]NYS80056.1 formate dehydrogenase subunit alpha [Halomonas glaciei]RBI65160.1 formate dehydrogenase subunit alpha [Halomonas sulfidaeris]|tara:strand:- start:3135 stop:6101 length:2967 start_codon:yes stop_codon:yes gene_type:complete